jgi:glycosyltransferase involved in cell wall biosynthesis
MQNDSRRGVLDTHEVSPAKPQVIVDALAARTGGTAQAAVEVARRLTGVEVIVVAREGSMVARQIRQRPGLRVVELPRVERLELPRRLAWEARALPELVRQEGGASVLTWSGMLPRDVDGRVVCYLWNSLMFASGGAANALRRWAVRRTVGRGADVLVPSRAMAELVGEALGVQPEVVPPGVDHARFRPGAQPGSDLLYVADFYRHKRHDVLLDAWAALPSPRPRLRLIGDPTVDRSWHREVTSRAARYRELGEIAFESALSPDEVAGAYRGARMFAVASEQESFCFPLLEAQASGVPAVARDLPVLRETGGEGTTYVSGDEPQAWAAAMLRLLTDEGAWTVARTAGLEHARGFSWEKTTEAIRARLLPG